MQLLEPDDDKLGEAFHIVDGSSFAIKSGYHPCAGLGSDGYFTSGRP